MKNSVLQCAAITILFLAAAAPAPAAGAANPNAEKAAPNRVLVRLKAGADKTALFADIARAGGKVVRDLSALNVLVVSSGDPAFKNSIAQNPGVAAMAPDRVKRLIRPEQQQDFFGKAFSPIPQQTRISVQKPNIVPPSKGIAADPAFSLLGLMWNIDRISAPQAWTKPRGTGVPNVLVAVADTGLDYNHADLQGKVVDVVDLTLTEDPPICKTLFGVSDAELASSFGVAADEDFNGHGSWIGGNIAGKLNGAGINGAAPNVGLVSLKISQWCGFSYSSTEIGAFLYAADHGVDIVSISFGGYLDRTDPDQEALYQLYVAAVAYARAKGTVIVAAAGNEHMRIGAGGEVISHGVLSAPPGGVDAYGLWEVPGGVEGVIDVSATGNVVNASSATCPADSLAAGANQWCKKASDAHQPTGVGLQNQLTYYSNYGPRIDFAAPGGARKFNLPFWDVGGTPGWPVTGVNSIFGGTSTVDGYNAWEEFSLTSNYAQEIPCVVFQSFPGFTDNQCYSAIQGTSMATPHVSAALAIIASEIPGLRHKPSQLVEHLKSSAKHISGNTTTAISASDTSAGDLGGGPCTGRYCHLGGALIPDAEAFGAGLVSASKP